MSEDATSGAAVRTVDDEELRPLGEQIEAAMERLGVPGVAVGVWYEGREHVAGYGVTSIENPLPVTPDTLFQIGSTTKTITATAAMRLVEMGKLDLDAPVRVYLPDLRLADESVAANVTLRHLFTHTAGWVGDYFDDMGWGDDALARIVAKLADLPQLTPLGTVWSYCNSGFYLAGRVIEIVTGKPYETAVRELVLDPLGMRMSLFFAHDAITHRVAIGHQHEADGKLALALPWALPRAAHPAGGISSSVRDQLRYARFHMGDGTVEDGTRLLQSETLRSMQTPLVPAGGDIEMMGVTWMLRTVGGTRIVQHGGSTNGQQSAFLVVPDRGFAITILTNADKGGELHDECVKWALRHYLGLDDADPQPFDAPEERLAEYAGSYEARGARLDVSVRDGGLVIEMIDLGGFPTPDSPPRPPEPPVRAKLFAEDRVLVLDAPMKGARGEFLRGDDGAIVWLRAGGRIHRRT